MVIMLNKTCVLFISGHPGGVVFKGSLYSGLHCNQSHNLIDDISPGNQTDCQQEYYAPNCCQVAADHSLG